MEASAYVAPPGVDTNCPICISEFVAEDAHSTATQLRCGHLFHTACVQAWIAHKDHPDCPLCRADIIEGESKVVRIFHSRVRGILIAEIHPPEPAPAAPAAEALPEEEFLFAHGYTVYRRDNHGIKVHHAPGHPPSVEMLRTAYKVDSFAATFFGFNPR